MEERSLSSVFRLAAYRRFKEIRADICGYLIEREEAVDIVLTAFLCGHNVLFISKPGTAKSLMLSLLCRSITGSRYFYTELFRFTQPDVVFGPIDIRILESEAKARYNTEGYLPSAHFALVDEIFSGNPAIIQGMSPVLNPDQRVFPNGDEVLDCPTISVVTGTNRLPDFADEHFDLEKVWDRILFRAFLDSIGGPESFQRLLNLGRIPNRLSATITLEELADLREAASRVEVTDEVREVLWELSERLSEEEIWVSDRRWRWVMAALRAHAFLNRRAQVEFEDLLVLQHVFWNDLDEIQKVWFAILETAFPHYMEAARLYAAAQEAVEIIRKESKELQMRLEQGIEIGNVLAQLRKLLRESRKGWERGKIKEILEKVTGIQAYIEGYLKGLKNLHPEGSEEDEEDPDEAF